MDFALILDIVVLVIILISSVVAFLRGFVREVLTILGLGGAAMMALAAGPKLAPGIERWLTDGIADVADEKLWGFVPYPIAASVFAYAGLFVMTLIVLSIISHFIAKSVHAVGLGPVDRSLGVVFGILRGLVLIGLLYMPFHILMDDKDKEEWFSKSHTFTYVEYTAEVLTSMMPESWQRVPDEDAEKDKEELDPLKNLTGENDEKTSKIGTDEDAAEKQKDGSKYDDIQRKAIDILIENQDKIKDTMEKIPSNE